MTPTELPATWRAALENRREHFDLAAPDQCLRLLHAEDESRLGARLLIWSPPSSLALSRVSNYDFITGAHCLGTAETVSVLRPFRSRGVMDSRCWLLICGFQISLVPVCCLNLIAVDVSCVGFFQNPI